MSDVNAALALTFEPDSGAPGTDVIGTSLGEGALISGIGQTVPAFLVRAGEAIDDGIPLADASVDASGDVRLAFTVPTIATGEYEVWLRCEPCAPTSAGRSDLPVGTFIVLAAPPPTDTRPTTDPLAIFASLLVVSFVLAWGYFGRRGARIGR